MHTGFFKNRILNRFVTSVAHILQVVWPISLFCNMCDLSAHIRQVQWPRVPFTRQYSTGVRLQIIILQSSQIIDLDFFWQGDIKKKKLTG
jgi:hypothetical protein